MMMVDEIKESVVVVVVQGGGKDEGKERKKYGKLVAVVAKE